MLKEESETGNSGLVARNHGLNQKTVWSWVNALRLRAKNAPARKVMELEKALEALSFENRILKELLKKQTKIFRK